jgi:tRNA A37 threonylcarbamoyladenosine dehydratase
MAINPAFQRLSLITGEATVLALQNSRAFVFGSGGVGSWCAEGLVRSGIGRIVIVDSDIICITNVNRQLEATSRNVGRSKVAELKERLEAINPSCEISAFQEVYSAATRDHFDIAPGDYVIDAIDSLTFKLDLIEHATQAGATLFCAMGAANKLDPTRLKVADIWDTQGCPLAKLVRQGLRKRGFSGHFPAVYSTENLPPQKSVTVSCGSHACLCPAASADGSNAKEWCSSKKVINGSAVHVTAAAGMILAGLVVQDAFARLGAKEG